MAGWGEGDISDQSGRTALVTGTTSGLGLRISEVLASRGARVILTSRDAKRGAEALARVAAVAADAEPELVRLDLADLASVRIAADRIRSMGRIDLMFNNAGVMAPPLRFSRDGFELQWATNVLGPAALTWLLLPAIERTPGSRVVTVASLAHFGGRFSASRLRADARGDGYRRFGYYCRTKLADLIFSRELERHFRRSGAATISVAAHPGLAATEIASNVVEGYPAWVQQLAVAVYGAVSQPVEAAALPALYAATASGVSGSQYFGPKWLLETCGPPTRAARSPSSRSDVLGAALVDFIAESTGIPAPR